MAENENPPSFLRPDASIPPVTVTDRRGQHDASFSAGEGIDQSDYMLRVDNELRELREYRRQSLQAKPVCSLKTFMACKPSTFQGSSNPSVTLDWLRDIERKFVACKCDESDKVPFAVQLLKGQAMTWWDSITVSLTPQQRESIRWSDFYNEVCKRFCSDFDRARIRREFMNLQMTDRMTIDELIFQFSDKLRFVQQWVPDDKTQIEHFVETLPPSYRTTVRLASSLQQAFSLARYADSDLRSQDQLNSEKISRQSFDDSSGSQYKKKGKGKQSQKSSASSGISGKSTWCFWCKSRHVGPCTPQTARCIKCGLFGHEAKDCNYPTYVCWNCQRDGHRAEQCPEAVRSDSGVVSGSSSSGEKRKRRHH